MEDKTKELDLVIAQIEKQYGKSSLYWCYYGHGDRYFECGHEKAGSDECW